MIVYENTIGDFINQCNNQVISDIVYQSTKNKGFGVSTGEIRSWSNSLPFVANALNDDEIDQEINVAIEYKLHTTKNRVDFIIYGKDQYSHENIVIVELKQWSTVKDSNKPNYVYTDGGGGEKDYFHPSYQAYRYQNIMEGFNSFVQDNHVDVKSCSYLHNMDNIYEFILDNKERYPFIEEYPVFLKDDELKLRNFVKKYISKSNRKLLYEVDNARIRPSGDFSNLMYKALQGQPIFSLDDEQASSVNTIVYETKHAIDHQQRRTIIIKGGPGSGKSIVAVNALGQLIHPNDAKPYNVAYCTTNFTPRTLFSELLIGNDYKKSAIKELFKPLATFSRASEFDYDCILLDEAYRAFTWKFGQGVKREVDMLDKLFYASRVNVFFIDEDQMVTKDDYLTIDRIKEYANKYHSKIIEDGELCLSSQFRCMGGQEYISFVNSILGYNNNKMKYNLSNNYEFRVFDTATEMWNAIHDKQDKYPLSRLLAGYTHNWISQKDDSLYDFLLDDGMFKMKWNKKVAYSYINDPEQNDRIGCIHTIQGVDMQYAGVIFGKDIVYRDGCYL